MRRTLAAADIGSNTVHLLVASTDGRTMRRLVNESEWLSLGEVVSREHTVPRYLEDRLVGTLRRFSQTVRTTKASEFYIYATEAMRVAKNHGRIMERIFSTINVEVDLISPHREIELSLRGALLDTDGQEPMLLVEVGGGSVQIAWCQDHRIIRDLSVPLGTGRMIADTQLTSPTAPAQVQALFDVIRRELEPVKSWPPVASVVATGGVARGFLRALHPDGERRIHRNELEYLLWSAKSLRPEAIMVRFGVKEKRAQTLVPGAAVYTEVLEIFNCTEMFVSELGGREGAIMDLYFGRIK